MNINFCTNCGQQRNAQHKFCGECGSSLQAKAALPIQQITPDTDDIAAYNKHTRFLHNARLLSIFLAPLIIAIGLYSPLLLMFFSIHTEISPVFGCVAAVLLGVHQWLAKVLLGYKYKHRSDSLKQFYLQLPTGHGHENKPCCIFCGSKRTYKKGVYKTENDREVYCAECDHFLFDEPGFRLIRL